MLNIGQGAIIAAGLIGVMLLAAQGVAAGGMTVGDFVLVNAYLIQLYTPLNFLGMVYRNIKQSLTDLEQMMALLTIAPEIEDRPGAPPLAVPRGAVRFRHVDFRYDPRRADPARCRFSRCRRGRNSRSSGRAAPANRRSRGCCSASTTSNAGAIEIDGQDIRDVTQDSLRRAIGVVPQDTVLFNDTIFYNIAYGRPGASRAEVEEAARHARIHDFIASLPDGYDTMVGERGLKLSGGEKQRVAIARVVLKAPQILIFDEATSALDTKTEREIQASLAEVATRPHDAGHRAPALDRDRRRPDPGARSRPHRRARHSWRAACPRRSLCDDVGASAGSGGTRGGACRELTVLRGVFSRNLSTLFPFCGYRRLDSEIDGSHLQHSCRRGRRFGARAARRRARPCRVRVHAGARRRGNARRA